MVTIGVAIGYSTARKLWHLKNMDDYIVQTLSKFSE